MKTSDNRLMVLALSVRAAVKDIRHNGTAHGSFPSREEYENALASMEQVATELETYAGEGASDGEMLDWWFAHGLTDDECGDKFSIEWADGEREAVRWTEGTDFRDCIRKAMRGQGAAIEAEADAAGTEHSAGVE